MGTRGSITSAEGRREEGLERSDSSERIEDEQLGRVAMQSLPLRQTIDRRRPAFAAKLTLSRMYVAAYNAGQDFILAYCFNFFSALVFLQVRVLCVRTLYR